MNNNPCQSCGFSPSAKIKFICETSIPVILESGNIIGSNGYGPKGYKYRAAKKKYSRAINIRDPRPETCCSETKRRLTITRCYGKRKRKYDKDNFIWGCKPLIDILNDRAWFFDDDPKHLEVVYKQKSIDSPDSKVELILEQFTD